MYFTYIVGCSNSNAIFERMPAHVQNLLVEINLICIGLLSHSTALARCTSCRTSGSGSTLLSTIRGCRACGCVDRSWNANLFRLEGRLVCLQNNFDFLVRI